MKNYIGIKWIQAEPMNTVGYSEEERTKEQLEDEVELEGYKVIYEDGYESWSPKDVFEKAYLPTDNLKFGLAIEALKRGRRVARKGWNGKSMFLFLVPGSTFKVNRPPLLGIYEEGAEIKYHAHIDMKTASGDIVPWLASQTDVLAEDWIILD